MEKTKGLAFLMIPEVVRLLGHFPMMIWYVNLITCIDDTFVVVIIRITHIVATHVQLGVIHTIRRVTRMNRAVDQVCGSLIR